MSQSSKSMKRQGMAFNFSLLSVSTIIHGGLGFVTVVYLARTLGPAVYGLYNYTWTWVLLFVPLTQLGIPTWTTRLASGLKDSERIHKIQEAWQVLFWLGVMATVGFVGSTAVIPMPMMTKGLLFLWSTLLLQHSINPLWVYALEKQLTLPALGIILGAILRLAGTVLLIRNQGQLGISVMVTVISLWIAVLGPAFYLIFLGKLRWPHWPGWQRIHMTIRHSTIFASFGFVSILYSGIDVMILRHFSTLTQVGVYSAATRPTVFLWAFVAAFLHSFYPVAGQLAHDNTLKLQQLITNILRIVIIGIVPVVFGAAVVARPLIVGFFGIRYQAAAVPFALLVGAWVFAVIREVFSINLLANYGERTYLTIVLIGAGVNILAMLGLVRWGATGLAAALVISQGFVMLYTGRVLQKKTFHLKVPWRAGGLAVLNSFVMSLIVYQLLPYISVWIAIGIGMVVFVGLAFVTGLLTWTDMVAIKRS